MTLTSPCGVTPSLSVVNPFMSQNITVITRRWPCVATTAGWSSKSCATRGSMYFPKISLIRSLLRNRSIMPLNAIETNLVPRCHRYRFIEATRLNLPSALE